jgi:hypothetical protein
VNTDPVAPERVRLVDAHGVEVEATRVVYLGPDVEDDLHVFEAWFPLDTELPPGGMPPPVRIGMMPGRTSLVLRFHS